VTEFAERNPEFVRRTENLIVFMMSSMGVCAVVIGLTMPARPWQALALAMVGTAVILYLELVRAAKRLTRSN
jgi:uncharacterized MnhB-related membrane protein